MSPNAMQLDEALTLPEMWACSFLRHQFDVWSSIAEMVEKGFKFALTSGCGLVTVTKHALNEAALRLLLVHQILSRTRTKTSQTRDGQRCL